MQFDHTRYGPEVEALLAMDGAGQRLLPLEITGPASEEARKILNNKSAHDLFPDSRAPEAALSGLWLYFSCFDESHTISQDIATPDGSYWHGMLHRQEPDAENAAYWFRRVGDHPIFPLLCASAGKIVSGVPALFRPEDRWDAFAFIDFCEQARQKPGSEAERIAREIQRSEWQLLFDHCARTL